MSSKSERENVVTTLASAIFSAMLDDLVLDAALQSHHEVTRSRAVCQVCNTRCGLAHVPGPSDFVPQAVPPPSRPGTPASDSKTANGTSTPTSTKADGTIYLNCVNCNRATASSRYATHLSSCLGIGTGTRRGAARNTNVKLNNNSEGARSASPSEGGNLSDGPRDKGRSKSKRTDDVDHSAKRKRTNSPQLTPQKKSKNQKTPASPMARVKSDGDHSGVSSNPPPSTPSASQSKIPSKLRESSTASFIDREESSSSSSASPISGTPVASPSTPSSPAISAHSPSLTPATINGGAKRKKGKAAPPSPPKPPSPPRPPQPLVRVPEPDYLIDVEGEETGSSTDTDSA